MSNPLNQLTEADYLDLLRGKNRGSHYGGDFYLVKTKKNLGKTEMMLNGAIGKPNNLNPDYDTKINIKKPRRKKINRGNIDPQLLRMFD